MLHDGRWNHLRMGRVALVGVRGLGRGLSDVEQIGIALSGIVAVWLTQDRRDSWRRWACIFGMLGQPFWFYAAWKAEQWGIFLLCTLYTYAWARGLWTHWLTPYAEPWERLTAAAMRWRKVGEAHRMPRHSPPAGHVSTG